MYGFCYWDCGFLPQHLSFIRQETLVYCCIPTTKKNIWNKEGIEWIFVGWVMMNHFSYFLFINILILWWISAATYRQKFRYDWQGIFLVFSFLGHESVSCSVVSDSLQPHGLKPARLLRLFSKRQYWSGLPLPFPGALPDPRIKSSSSALQADPLPSEPSGTVL